MAGLRKRVDDIVSGYINSTPETGNDGHQDVIVTRTHNVQPRRGAKGVWVTCRVFHLPCSRPFGVREWENDEWRSGLLGELMNQLKGRGYRVEALRSDNGRIAGLIVEG